MDDAWVGRKLMCASDQLGDRFRMMSVTGALGLRVIAPIARGLLREVGHSLILREDDPGIPFARTSGMVRLPFSLAEAEIIRAYKGLAALVSHYLQALPGADAEMERFAIRSVRQAALVTARIRRELHGDAPPSDAQDHFGGAVLLAYDRHGRVEPLQAIA